MESTGSGYRLRVRVGTSEFDAEGPEELVKSQFEMFLKAVNSLPAGSPPSTDTTNNEKPQLNEPASNRHRELLRRAYMDDGDRISLRVLPQGQNAQADALLLIVYGFYSLKEHHDVSATDLTGAARKSGLDVARVDRAIPSDFIARGGRAKGTRYSLNNRGIARAQELLEALFK